MVLNRGRFWVLLLIFSSKRISDSAWRPFQCHTREGAAGTDWVDPRDAAQCTGRALTTKNKELSDQNLSSAEAETSTLNGL